MASKKAIKPGRGRATAVGKGKGASAAKGMAKSSAKGMPAQGASAGKATAKASASGKATPPKAGAKAAAVKPAKESTGVRPAALEPHGGKAPAPAAKGKGMADSKGVAKGTVKAPPAPASRYSVMSADAMAASRAAAAKLAAAAGLNQVKQSGNGEPMHRSYTRITKTPFSKKELDEFREILLAKRAQLAGDVNSMETEALAGGSGSLSHLPQHMADQGSDTYDQALALDLAASQRGLLKEIDDALARIEKGTYGICEEMGKPISVERLRHTPWARYCIEAARQHERAAYFR